MWLPSFAAAAASFFDISTNEAANVWLRAETLAGSATACAANCFEISNIHAATIWLTLEMWLPSFAAAAASFFDISTTQAASIWHMAEMPAASFATAAAEAEAAAKVVATEDVATFLLVPCTYSMAEVRGVVDIGGSIKDGMSGSAKRLRGAGASRSRELPRFPAWGRGRILRVVPRTGLVTTPRA